MASEAKIDWSTNEGKLAQALKLKEEGNAFVREKEYKRAISKYTRVFAFLKGFGALPEEAKLFGDLVRSKTTPITAEQQEDLAKLSLATHSNLALCYLKLGQASKVIEHASQVINADPQHVKAHYYSGMALIEMQEFERGESALNKALELAPNDPAIQRGLESLVVARKAAAAKEKRTFAGLFDRMANQDQDG